MIVGKMRFLAVFVLASALLSSGVPFGLMNRAHALQFMVEAPGLAGRKVVITLNDKAAAAVSKNSGGTVVAQRHFPFHRSPWRWIQFWA